MIFLTKEALLVRNALISNGIENPLCKKILDYKICQQHISEHIMHIMRLLNLDLNNESLKKTPHRISKMYVEEVFSGLNYANFPKITIIKNRMKLDEVITVRNITLTSICEHHFVMIDGKATVAYLPKNNIIGLSKINRIVKFFAQRPQVQERLTQQILVALQTLLDNKNVAVSINAIHFCVKARGIYDTCSNTTTTALGGVFKSNHNARQEFIRFTS